MNKAIKFGFFNSIIGILIGAHVTYTAIGNGYWIFIIAAPISAFLCGVFFWNFIDRKSKVNRKGKIILIGLLTGSVSHYICWVLLSIGMNICYWTTGNCTGSLGDPPAKIIVMILGAFVYLPFSLLMYGWITIPSSIGIGFLISQKNNA